jgi:hypothetical protein
VVVAVLAGQTVVYVMTVLVTSPVTHALFSSTGDGQAVIVDITVDVASVVTYVTTSVFVIVLQSFFLVQVVIVEVTVERKGAVIAGAEVVGIVLTPGGTLSVVAAKKLAHY